MKSLKSSLSYHAFWFILALFFLPINTTLSQDYISGTVVDVDAQPIEFANVLAFSLPDSALVEGTITDEKGAFQLNAHPDIQFLKVSYLGYEDRFISLEPDQLKYDILLSTADIGLEEVVVTGRKVLYELKHDRIMMNVSAAPALQGNTALQVLQKAPGVIVNRQNNSISLNGKGEVLIMINNKIQRIPNEVLLAKLEGMQAENVEQIELIHQPSARYDASGAAGIIHIVLKQNQDQGTNGNIALTLGYGQREKAGVSANFNYRRTNFNIYGDYTFNRDYNDQYQVNHYRAYDYEGDDFYYENLVKLIDFRTQQQSASAGMDINLGEKTIAGVLFNYANNTAYMESTSISSEFINGNEIDSRTFLLRPESEMQSLMGNFNLLHQFNETSNLNFDLDYVTIDFNNNGIIENGFNGGSPLLQNRRETPIDIWTIKLDNINQLNENTRLEFGAKATLSSINSFAEVQNLSAEDWAGSDLIFGRDDIKEKILAVYGSISTSFTSKLNGELGLRFEHFDYQLNAADDTRDLHRIFNNPFPIARLNYELNPLNTFQLSFNRTIVRPDFNSLSAYFLFLDPTLFVYSNPRLQPTFTNTYKLSWKHQSMIFSLAYLDTENRIYYFNTVDKANHLQTSTPSNLDQSRVWEATASMPFRLTDWWEVNTFMSVLYQKVEARALRPLPFTDQITTYTLQLNSSFNWGEGWSASFDGQYMSSFLTGDQVQKIYPFLNLGIRKKFASGAALSLSFQDVFNSIGRIDWEYHQPALGIRTFGDNDWSERQIRLTYSFLLGNQKLSGKRQRATGASEVKKRM